VTCRVGWDLYRICTRQSPWCLRRRDADHPRPFPDRGQLRRVGGVQGRRRRSRSDGSVWGSGSPHRFALDPACTAYDDLPTSGRSRPTEPHRPQPSVDGASGSRCLRGGRDPPASAVLHCFTRQGPRCDDRLGPWCQVGSRPRRAPRSSCRGGSRTSSRPRTACRNLARSAAARSRTATPVAVLAVLKIELRLRVAFRPEARMGNPSERCP
jgi:hypothetical protein